MRKTIKWALFLVIFPLFALMWTVAFQKLESQKTQSKNFATLPSMTLIATDTTPVDLVNWSKHIVLLYFNSDCDHCQYEALEIKNNFDRLRNTKIIFMSSEPLSKIRDFAEAVQLNTCGNIHFTYIDAKDASSTFGPLAIPHIFIYGPDKKLKKEFKGETKIEAILTFLQ